MPEKYRKNVGIVLCKEGKILLFARADQAGFQWQFPQGGIEDSESVIDAAKRELKEETGLSSVRLLFVMPGSIKYDFPKCVREKNKNNYVGQDQHWVLFEFLGKDTDINFFTNPKEVEFKDFKWADMSEAVKDIISFKKQVYQKVAECFTPFIEENSHAS